ncbi:glycosyl transferase [Ornithinimicrobium cerasi]|uniref:Glycosyltransferase involved in cell wall bisynthesis n=1 Tax=Ornithinimicrobium cerasi TaxID=2248773 RepID=A0A285VEB6_9MICO|nr:glycosyl transferase [Ornithinimicrobium cerasi]SOC52400.1 Glycosyltransferase involved in cell wall bisynthesis [Ornithinimicrobium cerasi]
MTRPAHVLYVAWGFPPARGGGVYRALATSAAFADAGARVTVLTAAREAFERYTAVDAALEAHVHPEVSVRRLPFDWPAREPDRARWSAVRRAAPRVWWRVRKELDRVSFPEVGYGPWRRVLEAGARQVHADRAVDLVVATANPYVDLVAADVLHRDHGVPYVVDYRDAWQLDVFTGRRKHRRGSRVDRLEGRLMRDAREVWFVNEPIRAWHAEQHPAAAALMHVVANGYDPQFAPAPRLEAPDPARPLRFGYIGTMSRQVPLEAFRAGWAAAAARSAEVASATAHLWGHSSHYAVEHPGSSSIPVTPGTPGTPSALPTGGSGGGVVVHGPVSKTAVAEVYAQLDVLLLILGTGRYVTSGKVYEYLASALPVVSVHDPGNAATQVLVDYPLWFPARDLSAEAVATALVSAAAAARTADRATRQACADFALASSREAQLGQRVSALLDAAR